ncbi:toxin-antitoxin system HicB family antitoxin [Parafrankia irregularis]|uniref:toxin-antitoxin system HicB family antitoxin n=1 Tax=Parafrankia irregularis TaxID=795642 RepID=UPI001868D751|nr:toxin-antitoxin system HicB family antitoxin [Parafrankia irregularis]MBE3206768.1 toxin-antitoxin system HicB family antitoxin [Parafrankia sp. CH37]
MIKARTSPEVKARAEAAAAAAGVTFNRWLEELVLREAPPLLDLDTTSVSDQEDVQMAS